MLVELLNKKDSYFINLFLFPAVFRFKVFHGENIFSDRIYYKNIFDNSFRVLYLPPDRLLDYNRYYFLNSLKDWRVNNNIKWSIEHILENKILKKYLAKYEFLSRLNYARFARKEEKYRFDYNYYNSTLQTLKYFEFKNPIIKRIRLKILEKMKKVN